MTYCIGLYLDQGLVLLSDTRTNAGVDNVSVFRKLHVFEKPGERVIALQTAGNLAVSQAVLTLLEEGLDDEEAGAFQGQTIWTVTSMFQAARLVGEAVRTVWRSDAEAMQEQDAGFNVSILLSGQIEGRTMRLFQIYSAGNFIQATHDTPFFQIGEHKYGKPILDRAIGHETGLTDAVKVALISMDSTLRSNMSVGLPLDLLVYRRDSCKVALQHRIDTGDDYYAEISEGWSQALRDAYSNLPPPPWLNGAYTKARR